MPEPQSFKNHARLDPPSTSSPSLSSWPTSLRLSSPPFASHSARTRDLGNHIWLTAISLALLVAIINMRLKDLRVQGSRHPPRRAHPVRRSAPAPDLAASSKLTLRQVLALRFASDAELHTLITRAWQKT